MALVAVAISRNFSPESCEDFTQEWFTQQMDSGNPVKSQLRILVTGKQKTGKTTLINGLFGGSGRGSINMAGVEVIVDYPGCQDSENKMMKEVMEEADLVLHTVKMDDTRVRPEDIKCVQQLTADYGNDLWTKAIFVLTFANRVTHLNEHQKLVVSKELIQKRVGQWKDPFFEALKKDGISEEILRNISFVPAGHYLESKLFDSGTESWMDKVSRTIICRVVVDEESRKTFLKVLKKHFLYK